MMTIESDKKKILYNQCRPADGKSRLICGLLLLPENRGPEGLERKKPSKLRLGQLYFNNTKVTVNLQGTIEARS
ncbi:MAG: hypothetical protein M3299_11355 [Thermoproteota archaeon]|nr:hypothetical protein [Thermoproteota archaeon]